MYPCTMYTVTLKLQSNRDKRKTVQILTWSVVCFLEKVSVCKSTGKEIFAVILKQSS